MVDFRKRLGTKEIPKKIDPIEIYGAIDRRSITGPLRPTQELILKNWFKGLKNQRDLIIKLHTGEGKTLIGLLILQSKLNSGEGPCLFVCPNIYLVEQVCSEAKKFGIPFTVIEDNNELPNEFLEGKSILITHVQKLFNGKSIFGIDHKYCQVGTVILDDSHACIDSIKSSFTISIDKKHILYSTLKTLFENDIKSQGEGSFLDIENGDYSTFLPIPYWSWIEKRDVVLEHLSKHKDDIEILFSWPLIKDSILNYQGFISGNRIEISPYFVPIHHFGTFDKAQQRILMSATTQDDSFFIRGLGFSIEAVKNPLTVSSQKWSGEKMILIPSLIHDRLDRITIINKLAPPQQKKYGIVALTPSIAKSELYSNLGGLVASPKEIFKNVNDLKSGKFTNTLVLPNRYDGIDLPDESCRLLVLDSMPYFSSLVERYEEYCRADTDISNIKFAQKIEQGLGRSVRGEKDYSVIVIIGNDLVKFLKGVRTRKYFSSQTRKQIDIGLEIAKLSIEDLKENDDPFKVVSTLINQSITRDEAWKEFYKENMGTLADDNSKNGLYEILKAERDSEEAYYRGKSEIACEKMQKLIDSHCNDTPDRGWQLQNLARYKYSQSKTESNATQKGAFESNNKLLKPKDGITYKKLEYINENRIKRIKEFIDKFSDYEELRMSVEATLDNFSFGISSVKFEEALKEIGEFLGFLSQRPDAEFKKGPDNLWCGVDDKYFMFECKSEVEETRAEIIKSEAGQMNSHCGWFKAEYGEKPVKRILIIPTKNLSYNANFTHDVAVMRKGKINTLIKNIKGFFNEFKSYNIHELSDTKIQEFIDAHKLDINSLETLYSEKYYHRSK
jgi:replicative superfamily II helicase